MAEADERERTLAFLNEELTRENEQLLKSADSLDTKATFVAGVAAAAIPFLLANRRGTWWDIALCLYALGVALAVASLWPRHWAGLIPSQLHNLSGAAPRKVIGAVSATKIEIFARNYRKAAWKLRLWTGSVLVLGSGTVAIMVSTITEKAHGG